MIYSAVRMKDENEKNIDLEVKFTVDDVRRVSDLEDKDEDPIIILERLSKGFWFRMGYAGHANDKGYIKSRFCRPYKFMVQCVVHSLSQRKGAYDKTSDYIMNIIACLVLNRPYNISQVIFNHMVDNIKGEKYIKYPRFIQMLLDDQVPNLPKDPKDELKLNHMGSETLKRLDKYKGLKPDHEPRVKGMIGKIKKKDYVAPENDQWRHVDKTEKKKSPPTLIDETVIPPTELIKKGADLLNMTFDEYMKHTDAKIAKATNVAEKEADTTANNVEAEGVKETLVEGVVQSDSSATESDEVDPTKIAPTSYVSGKQKYKGSPTKKKYSDEEDSTYVPTSKEKRKGLKKRKARHVGVVSRSVRAKKDSTTVPEVPIVEKSVEVPEVQSVQVPEVERKKAPESPIYERVEKNDEFVEVEFMGERKSTPPPTPINPTIHIHDDPKKTPEEQLKKATTSSSSHGFPKVIGEYPEDLPEGDFDIFNEGKINVLTKKLSVLEKAKAKVEAKLEAVKAENVALKKELEEHAGMIDKLGDELEKVNDQYKSVDNFKKLLHEMSGDVSQHATNENKALKEEIEALRADKVVKDEELNMLYTKG
ncbi:hypothetical protein HanHA300_Chr04g0133531 [Helianthus annuus]|nr:hypothetical protein HanHA300_Chr04g0133531 [Helianthus annuus]